MCRKKHKNIFSIPKIFLTLLKSSKIIKHCHTDKTQIHVQKKIKYVAQDLNKKKNTKIQNLFSDQNQKNSEKKMNSRREVKTTI